MKSFAVPFAGIDEAHNFIQLANKTHGHLENDNTIRWSDNLVRGQVKKWHLDAGLHMRVWELVFSEPAALCKEAVPLHITHNNFSLLCILTPSSVALKSVNQHQQVNKVRDRSMVLVPDNVNTHLHITANMPVQLIDFQIAPYWLKNQPGYLFLSKYFDEHVVEHNSLPVLIEPCIKKNYLTAGKLFSCAVSDNQYSGELLSLSTGLITSFMEMITGGGQVKTYSNVDMYYEKVMEAEAILIAYLQSTLPRLGNVAQQVALSESTLKRYFKQIFGKSIYEYYLVKKMEMARTLMMEKPLTVNEAAELMGYEKVSNFIDIFKKHHGYSPGTIRKKNISMQDKSSGTFMA